MRIAGWVLVAALLLLGLLTLDPARIGLSGTTPVLQAIALRGLSAAAAGTVALLLLLPAGTAALLRWRTVAAQVLVLAAGAGVVAGGHGAVLSGRGHRRPGRRRFPGLHRFRGRGQRRGHGPAGGPGSQRLHPGGRAGDYNATRDHAVLREASCLDAAAEAGAAGAGTWPADRPRWQGAQIDHMLLDGEAWQVLGAQVLESPGGDHRPVLALLAPAS